ncbi:MAG: thiol reductant ABC exporter subunit CydD, partial [Eggerthellaceae bacterium]|nr:thiol reductant ABC exporter subunit CydD [Eggerthellaceae bacterium]
MIDRSLFALPKVGMVMGILLGVSLAYAACTLGEAFSLAQAITNLWEGGALPEQVTLLCVFAACFVGKQVLVFGRDTFLARFSQQRVSELRDQLLDGVFGSKSGIVSEHGSAAVTQAALDGIDQVETYLSLILPKIVGIVAIPIPVLIAVFTLDVVSGVILLVFFPVIIFFMILIGKQASARAEAQYSTYNALSNHFIDTLRGIETLKVFGRSKSYRTHIFESSEDFRRATIETLKIATLSSGVLDLIATLGVAAVALMLGFRLLDGTILLLPALTVLILSPEFFLPIRDFAGDFHASLDGKNALVSIMSMVSGAAKDGVSASEVAPWNAESVLRFDNVSFCYDQAEDAPASEQESGAPETPPVHRALDDISFEAKGFAKVGVVGVSGSG